MPFFSYIFLLSRNLIYVQKEEELRGKKTYRSFATRVSQLKIWHFWLTRQIHIEWQSKHNYVYVIYKVCIQTSQPTTCFGLFQLGHLQVGHKGQRKYCHSIWICLVSYKIHNGDGTPKDWHFWVIGIERNVWRCTFNRYSVITQFAKLAAGEQLCRRCTHRKL